MRSLNLKLKIRIIELYRCQTDFAYELKVCESLVSKVVTGSRKLSIKQQNKWCKLLKCSTDIFKTKEENK